MFKLNIIRQPKDFILFSFFALLLLMGHRTGFITILSLFSMFALLILPLNRYIDTLGLILVAFTILFTFIGALNGCIDSLSTAVAYYFPTIFFYCFGKYIVDKIGYKDQLFVVIIVIVALYSLEIYTTILDTIISTGSIVNISREFYFQGDESRKLTATLVGLCVSLGFIGLPMSIIYRGRKLINFLFFSLFILSLVVTVHLINRTGLVICILSLGFTIVYYYRHSPRQLIFALVLLIALFVFFLKLGFTSQEVFEAYSLRNDGELISGGGRTERWQYALKQLFISPLGWAENSGKTDYYVHNMWLDVAKITGIIPFLLLCCSTMSAFRVLLQLIRIKRDLVVAMLLSLNVCFFFSCFVEPVYGGLHFFLYMMLWGIQKQYLVRFNSL